MASFIWAVASRIHRRTGDEEGFTLIELMIAIGVIAAALFVLMLTATAGFSSIALARQRQTANNLANQTMEQLRALPFSYIANGLATTDLATDPLLSGGSPGSPVQLTQNACPSGSTDYCLTVGGTTEQIPNGSFNYSSVPPLIPHIQKYTPPAGQAGSGSTYTIAAYITDYCPNGPSDGTYCGGSKGTPYVTNLGDYRATVVVAWSASEAPGSANTVVDQSVFYNPSGCVSSTTHPFQSPCQPFFYGSAGLGPGAVQITGLVAGTTFSGGTLWLPHYDANVQREQLNQVTGHWTGGGATLSQTGSPDQNTGQVLCQTQAGDDPATSNPAWQQAPSGSDPCSAAVPQQVSGALSTGGTVSLTVDGGEGDTGQTTSTVADSTSQPCVDYNLGGTSETGGLPCSSTQSLQSERLRATLSMTPLRGGNLGSADIVSIAPPSCASLTSSPNCGWAFDTYRATSPDPVNSAWCPTTTVNNGGVGCLHAEAGRVLGTAAFGQLPWGGLDDTEQAEVPGWVASNGLFSVANYKGQVQAEIGNGAASPPVSASMSGTLSYYNGSGYSTVGISGGAPATVNAAGVCMYDAVASGGPLLIAITSSAAGWTASTLTACSQIPTSAMSIPLSVGGSSVTASTCAPGPGTCTAATNGPVTGSFWYTVVQAGLVYAQVKVSVNFGQLLAKATYSSG